MKQIIKNIFKTFIPPDQWAELKKLQKKIINYGFNYKCPICNSRLKKFFPFGYDFPVLNQKNVIGGGYRSNALCPVCGSFDRERLLYLYLLFETDIFKKQTKLLHIAPENSLSTILKKRNNIDYSTADLDSRNRNVMIQMDITDIKFPDSTFDAVICNHVLEHIIDDRKAMCELFRILKPGGWSILQVPLSLSLEKTYEDYSISTPSDREHAFGQYDHVRIYGKDYYKRLEEEGFKVNQFNWWQNSGYFGGPGNRFGLIKNESIIFVTKA